MTNSARESFMLKVINLILLPIFIAIIIIYAFEIAYVLEYPEVQTIKEYTQTQQFSDRYMSRIRTIIYNEINKDENNLILENGNSIYFDEINNRFSDGYFYLIILEDGKTAYTNINRTTKTDSTEKIKQYLLSADYYWALESNNINTNIENLKIENIKYDANYNYIEQKIGNGTVYVSLYKDITQYIKDIKADTNIYTQQMAWEILIYNTIANTYNMCYILLPISIAGFLATSIYLIASCGYKKGEKNIYLNWFDKLPLELMILLAVTVITIESLLLVLSVSIMQHIIEIGILLFIIMYFIISITTLLCIGSIIKRFKSKTFIRNSFIYKIIKWIIRKLKNIYNNLIYNVTDSLKIIVIYGGFILISILLCLLILSGNFLAVMLLLAFWIGVFVFLTKHFKEFLNIRNALRNIYNGNTDIKLNTEELKGLLKEMAIYINDIAGGLSNAIEENLKSERLKTELITNVSHDLKTPLTSIINYVDLLKKEDVKDEKIKEYIRIIDEKSMRLKKLTEDLVEASKASSGNIKLQLEKIDVKQIIQQITGEFEDKFAKNNLEIITTFPNEETNITADGRYLSRVLENLCGNIAKYTMPNTRVYIDVIKEDNNIKIQFKNISKEKLNISAEELMQRFVRGDSSRNTEGSGLGLSIAQSLTELQKGKFELILDGDLFKAVVTFEERKY